MYQRSRVMSSSLPPRQKTYEYLYESELNKAKISPKLQTKSPSKRQKQLINIQPYSHQKSQSQYELIVQFQLRRQKQKTLILEQRLRNKQSFIKQMKQFQDQLTLAFQKCQEELLYYKKQCQNYQTKFHSYPTFNNHSSLQQFQLQQEQSNNLIRQYLQQIAELKHLVIRQQEQISYYEQKEKLKQKNLIYSSSAKKQFYPQQSKLTNHHKINQQQSENVLKASGHRNAQKKDFNCNNISSFQNNNKNQSGQINAKNQKQTKLKNNMPLHKQRSKTLANQFVNQKSQINFNNLENIQECIRKQTHKIISFINHFLTMTQFFLPTLSPQDSVKQKLKKAWKWIKNVVVEWNHLKNQHLQKIKQYKLGNKIMQYFSDSLPTSQIQKIIQKSFRITVNKK